MDDKFGSLEVYKLCMMMISLEVWKFTNCEWTDKFGSLEVYRIVCD